MVPHVLSKEVRQIRGEQSRNMENRSTLVLSERQRARC
jgi:hypothetical protein